MAKAPALAISPDWKTNHQEILKLAGLFLVACGLRGLYYLVGGCHLTVDGATYALLGRNWITGQGYVLDGQPHTLFPPFYPMTIGLLWKVLGDLELAGRLISLAASLFTLVPFYLLGKRLFGTKVAFLAALLLTFDGRIARLATAVLSEPLFTLLFVTLLYLGWRALEEPSLWLRVSVGAVSALAYLTRPEGMAMFAVYSAFLAITRLRQPEKRRRLALHLSLLVIPFLLLSAPYLIFLRQHTGRWQLCGKTAVNDAIAQLSIWDDRLAAERIHFSDGDRGFDLSIGSVG